MPPMRELVMILCSSASAAWTSSTAAVGCRSETMCPPLAHWSLRGRSCHAADRIVSDHGVQRLLASSPTSSSAGSRGTGGGSGPCAAPGAPPAWWPASASATCRTRCATPTHAPPCATTWPRPPRPPRRPRRGRLPRRHEHRLTSHVPGASTNATALPNAAGRRGRRGPLDIAAGQSWPRFRVCLRRP